LTRCRSPLRGGVEPEIQKCFKPLKQVYTFNKLIFKMAGLYPHKTITYKRFMEGVDPWHFIEEKVTSIYVLWCDDKPPSP
jgi:hypothetical protein